MRKLLTLFTALLFVGSVWGVNGGIASSIAAGDQVVLVNTGETAELSGVSNNIGNQASYSGSPTGTCILTVEAGKSGSGYSFRLSNGSYLAYTNTSTSKNNNLYLVSNPSTNDEKAQVSWTVDFDNSKQATIVNVYNTSRTLYYNASQPRFCCYTSAQTKVKFFKVIELPTLTITTPTGGTLVITDEHEDEIESGAEIEAGTELTVTAIADATHKNPTITILDGEDNDVTDEVLEGTTLTMPNYDINISASFETKAVSAITVTNPAHGTIEITGAANLANVIEGVELTVSVSGAGYTFTPKAYKTGDESTVVPITNGKITMPTYDITITAEEEEITTPTIEVSETALDWGSVAVGTALAGKTFAISGLNLTANVTLAWDGEGDDAFTYEVTTGSLTPTDGAVSATITVTPKVSAVGSYVNELTVSSTGATSQAVDAALTILQTYTAKWFINSTTTATQTQTAVAGTALMASPDDFSEFTDCSDLTFMGWAEAPIATTQQSAPTYTSKTEMPEADVNFYAVFATKNVDIIKNTTNIAYSGATTNMTGNNDAAKFGLDAEQWSVVGAKGSATNNVGLNTDGTIRLYYNAGGSNTLTITAPSTIDSVGIDFVNGKANGWVKVGGVSVAAVNGKYPINATSFVIGNANTSSAQVHMTNIAVIVLNEDVSYSDYLTTCPHCETVTLVKAGETNGTFVLKNSGVAVEDVKTCDAVSLTIDATPAMGYELTNVVVDGVGATYSEGVISIPQGAAGTLTVTATFSQSNYTVTMEQTGDASATMSADQTNKHFNDEITVSTNEPAGYVFLGWTASPAVEFADAKALETTFNLPNGNITVTANFAKLYTVAEAIYAIDNDGVVEGVVVEGYVNNDVTASSSSYLNYYIQDVDANGFLTGTTFEAYRGKNIGNVNFKKDEGVKLGAKVRIYGNIKYYQNNDQYELDQNNYLLSYNEGTYDGVEIYGSATTTTYDAGDEFSTVGLNAKDVWDNGYAEAIAYADVEWAADPTIILANTSSVAVTATYDDNTSAPYNVNVTVKTYAVTFNAPEYGTLVVKDGEEPIKSGDEFVKGTVLTVVATPESGYQLATLTAGGEDILSTKSFTIGTADVEVVATFSQATALDNTELDSKAVKVMRNGILYIEKNGKTYNAQGQLVK